MSDLPGNEGPETGYPVQIDLFGIKAVVPAQKKPDRKLKTWREVGGGINQHLKGIAEGLFGLVDDAISGIRRLLTGVAALPGSMVSRIARAHRLVDASEGKLQGESLSGETPALPPSAAARHLEELLQGLAERGVTVGLRQTSDGKWVLILTKDEYSELAAGLGQLVLDAASAPESESEEESVAEGAKGT